MLIEVQAGLPGGQIVRREHRLLDMTRFMSLNFKIMHSRFCLLQWSLSWCVLVCSIQYLVATRLGVVSSVKLFLSLHEPFEVSVGLAGFGSWCVCDLGSHFLLPPLGWTTLLNR